MFLQLETSRVLRRLQCRASRNKDLCGFMVKSLGTYLWLHMRCAVCGVGCRSPVSDVITTGEVEMLQSLQVRGGLCHPTVADARAVAEI